MVRIPPAAHQEPLTEPLATRARPQRGSHTRAVRIGAAGIHVLALGPLSLISLEQQLQQAQHVLQLSHLLPGPFAGAAPRAAPRAPRRTPRAHPAAPRRVASARGARDGRARTCSPAPPDAAPPAGLQIADKRQDSQRHHLRDAHYAEASPAWRGYTAEQRSTLRALLASRGIEPAPGKAEGRGAQSSRADGEASAAGEIVISNEKAYREQKR